MLTLTDSSGSFTFPDMSSSIPASQNIAISSFNRDLQSSQDSSVDEDDHSDGEAQHCPHTTNMFYSQVTARFLRNSSEKEKEKKKEETFSCAPVSYINVCPNSNENGSKSQFTVHCADYTALSAINECGRMHLTSSYGELPQHATVRERTKRKKVKTRASKEKKVPLDKSQGLSRTRACTQLKVEKRGVDIGSYTTLFDASSFSGKSPTSNTSVKYKTTKKLDAPKSKKSDQTQAAIKKLNESRDDLSNSHVKSLLLEVDLERLKDKKIDQVRGHYVGWDSTNEKIFVAKKEEFAHGTSKIIYEAASFDIHSFEIDPSGILGIVGGKAGIESLCHEKSAVAYLTENSKQVTDSEYLLLPKKVTLSNSENQGIIMGDIGGTNLNLLITQDMPVRTKLGYGIRVFKAMRYLHKTNTVHRDLKPDNFVLRLNKNGKVQKDKKGRPLLSIIDLGNCYIEKNKEGKDVQKFRLEYMDPRFHCPELLEKMRKRGFPKDIDSYMAGMILINIFSGENINQFLERSFSEADNVGLVDFQTYSKNLLKWKNDYLNWPVWEQINENLIKQVVPQKQRAEIIKLLKSSIHPDPRKRPHEKKILQGLLKLEKQILTKIEN